MKRTSEEYCQRQTLLNKVKDFWIEGFLKNSIYGNNTINLDVKICSDTVLRSVERLEVVPLEFNESFAELKQTDIINQIEDGQSLLILGEPGSGKTIALLQLAEHLINQTLEDLTKPIPVVLNLSSWRQKQQPIEKWLRAELQNKYQIPPIWSKSWIEQKQIILLLDGLDEVQENHRNACVRAINKFITDGDLETAIVICSRVKDYEALGERLLLNSAIYIQPLSEKQLQVFLENADDSLLGLKSVIEQDREIAEFAKNPLILNMMTGTYYGWSKEQCLKQLRITQDREFNLFESYIENNLAQENKEKRSPKDKILHWLNWLAKTMVKESKIIFLIDKLRPTLLTSRREKINYRICNFLLKDLIIGLSIILSIIFTYQMLDWQIFVFIFWLIVGVIAVFSREITSLAPMNWSWKRAKSRMIRQVTSGLSDGLAAGIFIGGQTTFSILLLQYIIFPLSITLKVLSGIIIETPIEELMAAQKYQWFFNALWYGVICALSMMFIGGVIRGFNSGLTSSELKPRNYRNQGIGSLSKNSVTIGLFFGLSFGLIFGLSVALIAGLDKGLNVGLILGLNVGLILGLGNGGATCIQHFILRCILCLKGCMPWNYARFLDYASKCLLMKKVGRGYVFYNRMLMEHFAQR